MGAVGKELKLKSGATYCFYMLFVNNIKLFTDALPQFEKPHGGKLP